MKIFFGMFLVICCTLTHAASRQENSERLIAAQGIVEMFAQQKAQLTLESKSQSEQMMQQVIQGFNINDKFKEKLYKISNDFIVNLEAPWTPEEVAKVWSGYYTSKFTDNELEELVKYAESPLGQKDRQVSQKALSEFTAHFVQLSKPIYEQATNTYVADLKKALAECKCKKGM